MRTTRRRRHAYLAPTGEGPHGASTTQTDRAGRRNIFPPRHDRRVRAIDWPTSRGKRRLILNDYEDGWLADHWALVKAADGTRRSDLVREAQIVMGVKALGADMLPPE